MRSRLSQAIAITFFLYLIMGMGKLGSVPSASTAAVSQPPLDLKILPQLTLDKSKPKF